MHDFLTLKSREVEVGGAPEIISVLPMGHVTSAKGEFEVDEESFAAMKAQIARRGVDLVVDYEHQTLTGEQAPAAGWVKELFLDDGQIKARVEWTDRAKAYLSNKEYRYLSPVITVRKSDNKAMGLHSIALTNTPAIEHMEAIVNSLNFEGGQNAMDFLKELAKLLGLGEDATEEQVREALKACLEENKSLKETAEAGKQPPAEDDKVVANKEVCELLGLKAGAATADVAAAIMALKGGIVGGVNLAEQVKSLEAKLADRDAEEAVEMALKAGKITPAQRDWAKGYALKSLDDFKDFVEKAPQVVPMCQRHFKMSIFAEMGCRFLQGSIQVLYSLIHHITCWLEARQALIYQLVLGLTGETGKYNYSKAVHLYPPFFDIFCSAKNYKTASALTPWAMWAVPWTCPSRTRNPTRRR